MFIENIGKQKNMLVFFELRDKLILNIFLAYITNSDHIQFVLASPF